MAELFYNVSRRVLKVQRKGVSGQPQQSETADSDTAPATPQAQQNTEELKTARLKAISFMTGYANFIKIPLPMSLQVYATSSDNDPFNSDSISSESWGGPKHGRPGHVHGGSIPVGIYKVGAPGSQHADKGRVRENWIPLQPVGGPASIYGRKWLYIHGRSSAGISEGCIDIPSNKDYITVYRMVLEDGGGLLTVTSGLEGDFNFSPGGRKSGNGPLTSGIA